MGEIAILSLTSAFYPTLLAVTTVMLLQPDPERLMIGYWVGAMTTSNTLGLVIVFTLTGTGVEKTTEHTVSPVTDISLAVLFGLMALALMKGFDQRARSWRASRNERTTKPPPKWQRTLREGSFRAAFLIGAVLTLPGASYLLALDHLSKLHYPALVTAGVVITFNLVTLTLLEIPLAAYRLAPTRTPVAIDHAKAWVGRHGRTYAMWGVSLIAALFLIKGVTGLA